MRNTAAAAAFGLLIASATLTQDLRGADDPIRSNVRALFTLDALFGLQILQSTMSSLRDHCVSHEGDLAQSINEAWDMWPYSRVQVDVSVNGIPYKRDMRGVVQAILKLEARSRQEIRSACETFGHTLRTLSELVPSDAADEFLCGIDRSGAPGQERCSRGGR